eukprot:9181885-Prorocentrum_lima.AAC.1
MPPRPQNNRVAVPAALFAVANMCASLPGSPMVQPAVASRYALQPQGRRPLVQPPHSRLAMAGRCIPFQLPLLLMAGSSKRRRPLASQKPWPPLK